MLCGSTVNPLKTWQICSLQVGILPQYSLPSSLPQYLPSHLPPSLPSSPSPSLTTSLPISLPHYLPPHLPPFSYFIIYYHLPVPPFHSPPVPGGSDGPSGVLVCCENYMVYKNFGDQPDIRCPIPRRKSDLDDAERSMLLVCTATHKTKVSSVQEVFPS